MIKTFLGDEYDITALNTAREVLARFSIAEPDIDAEISYASPEEIQELNREYRGIDSATDVLSFCNAEIALPFDKNDYPQDINPEDGSVMIGEIYICPEVACKQAEDYGHSLTRETAFLVCHGMLHLLGFDHLCEDDEAEMFGIQDEILNGLNISR